MEERKLQIWLTPEGALKLSGPLNDKMLCYGLLEAAKDVIRSRHEKMESERRVEPVSNLTSLKMPGS